MTTVGAEFIIEIQGISCSPVLLGRSITIKSAAHKIRIDLPKEPESFKFSHIASARVEGSTPDPREYSPFTAVLHHGTKRALCEVRLIRVVINAESQLSVANFDSKNPAHRLEHDRLLFDIRDLALATARNFTDLVAANVEHPWIEPSGEFPRIVNIMELIDIAADRSFGVGIGHGGGIRVLGEDEILDETRFAAVADALMSNRTVSSYEILLAEARYILSSGQITGPERATLLGAVALEVNLKSTLNSLASAEEIALVGLLLNNPRDFSMSAHGLFLKALPIVAKGDLGEEHKEIARRVQKLFTARNGIAHTGQVISRDEATDHLQTVRDAFSLLKRLRMTASG